MFVLPTRDGKYIEFYANGKQKSVTSYVEGITDGEAKGYYSTGNKSWTARWVKGKPFGLHIDWYPEGQLKRQQSYSGGRVARVSEWHANGSRSIEAVYSNGRLVAQKSWDNNGSMLIDMNKPNSVQITEQKPVEINLGKPNPFATGRRVVWARAQIKSLYTGKPDDTIKAAFGAPDKKLGDNNLYNHEPR